MRTATAFTDNVMRAVLFDLDGTLCDTLGDLTNSMNYALRTFDYPTRTTEEMRTFVGNGLKMQVRRAAPNASELHLAAMESLFLAHYAKHCTERTEPYPGMVETLLRLKDAGLMLAVITNKPHECAVKIIDAKFPAGLFGFTLGNKPGAPLKPDPASLNEAMRFLGVTPADTVYVGDSGVDVQFAHAAALPCIGCAWGFRGRAHLEAAGTEHVVDRAAEIADILLGVSE